MQSDEADTERFNQFLTYLVGFLLAFVDWSIDFNNKALRCTIEVHYKHANWNLTPELPPIKPPAAYSLP